ncbi:phosphate uptake regulator PhoU [Halococcus thailandensis]|uniref:Phosphate uptake regulator / ABC transport system regulatory protein n=1 Tax=Halococcus thailandensis JCM 13552 TaxID=1227457 RepID=M0NGI5_9EURY|nr:phosphate uptake regulator PhoU [Halococcus thailandensis]EMA56663.1 phosphate uptake regulator / ABC transport system regulatory protein [Halococcus thailandensis JCM 13552]
MNASNDLTPSRETRKVQLTGGSTYTISLPKQWAIEHGIEAGRQLHIYVNSDGSLTIRANSSQETETTAARIAVDGYAEDDLRRAVQALYGVGLDEFTLTTGDTLSTAQRRAATRAATKLIGPEALEETETSIVFKNMISTSDESVRQSVLQLEYVTEWMHRNAVLALVNADTNRAERVVERDEEADRLFGLVNRCFQKSLTSLQEIEQLSLDRSTVFSYYTTARQLERVADHAEKIATTALRVEDPSSVDGVDELVSLANQSREIVIDAASVLLDGGSIEQAYTAFHARDELLEAVEPLDRRFHNDSSSDTYLLALVLDSVRRTAEYGGNIAEAMIQASVRSDNSS